MWITWLLLSKRPSSKIEGLCLKRTDFINFFGTFLNFSRKTSNVKEDNKCDTVDALFVLK